MTAKVHRATTWPLLRKDLTEMAAQGRGYWLRAGVVALGYAGFAWMHCESGQDVYLGGIRSFKVLNGFLAGAVTLFTPLVIASAIAGEKERNAFALLLVTPLTCWELLLEKFSARLVPLAGMMLCTLPLYAVYYSHGGIEPATLAGIACLQLANLLQAGAVGLCMSCRFQSTLMAVLMSWLFYGLLFLLSYIMYLLHFKRAACWFFFGFYQAMDARFHPSFTGDLWRLGCLLGTAMLLLLAARYFLMRHAFRKAGNRPQSLVRWLHRRLDWMRGRLRGGSMLPGRDAFLWRELHRLGIATFRFKVRLAVAAILLALFAGLCVNFSSYSDLDKVYRGFKISIWILFAVVWTLGGVAAGQADARRRSAETLALAPGGMAGVISARVASLEMLALLLLPSLLTFSATQTLLDHWVSDSGAIYERGLKIDKLLPTGVAWLVLPCFLIRYGLLFGTFFKSTAKGLAVAICVALIWIVGARELLNGVEISLLQSYDESISGSMQDQPMEAVQALVSGVEWIFSIDVLASPAGLPTLILNGDRCYSLPSPLFATVYLFLGMFLFRWSLRRVRKRYG